MRDALIFVGLMVAVVLLYIAWKLRGRSWREYFSTRDGKGILKGIIIAPGAILLIALALSLCRPAPKPARGSTTPGYSWAWIAQKVQARSAMRADTTTAPPATWVCA